MSLNQACAPSCLTASLNAKVRIGLISLSPSAVPKEAFGHVVYSWTCKHLYLYARSRRTSGQRWRLGSGPRPPLRSAAVKSSSPVLRARRRPPLRMLCAAPIRPCAMRCMRFTSAALGRCSRNHRARTPRRRSSMPGLASPSGRCCTTVPGRSASRRAGGPWRWLPK